HDQYELAVVCAGNDDELLHANGRADGPELRVRCSRDRDCYSDNPRICAAILQSYRELLGRSHAWHRLCSVAALDRRHAAALRAGRDSEPPSLPDNPDT